MWARAKGGIVRAYSSPEPALGHQYFEECVKGKLVQQTAPVNS
jgi:hypothetical protein